LTISCLATGAWAQASGLRIYNGQPGASTGIHALAWGSGEVREVEDQVFSGSKSIKVVSHGMYQGLRLVHTRPIDAKALLASKNAYIKLTLILPDPNKTSSSSGGGLGSPGSPGLPGGLGGGRLGGGRPGGQGLGGPGGLNSGANQRTVKPRPVKNLRVVLATTDGKKGSAVIPTEAATTNQDGWSRLSVPVGAFRGLEGSNGMLSEVHIFLDSIGTLNIGEITTTEDDTPIQVDDLSEQTIAVNDTVVLTGNATGGDAPLRYTWTISPVGQTPALDSVPPDAEGRVLRYQFRKSGDYEIVLTVRDFFGLKKPVSTKFKIIVTL
jgi:hypothetical protein